MAHLAAPSEFAQLPPLYRSEGFAEDLVEYWMNSELDAPPAEAPRRSLSTVLLAAPLAAALTSVAGIAAAALGLPV